MPFMAVEPLRIAVVPKRDKLPLACVVLATALVVIRLGIR